LLANSSGQIEQFQNTTSRDSATCLAIYPNLKTMTLLQSTGL
jgi:hypothetical protein